MRAPSRRGRVLVALMRLFLRPLTQAIPVWRWSVRPIRAAIELATSVWPFGPERGTTIEPVETIQDGLAINGEWVHGRGVAPSEVVLLYLHGSGYVFFSARTHRMLTSRLSRLTGLPVFSFNYRMAPEHQFPDAADDVLAAYRWLLAQSKRVVVAGDSVGGHLAFGLVGDAKDLDLPQPGAVVAMSPLVDASCKELPARDRQVRDPFMAARPCAEIISWYVADNDPTHPRMSPLHRDPRGWPRMLLQAGALEILAGDSVALHRHITSAGGPCDLELYPGMFHVFQAFARVLPEARIAVDRAAAFLRAAAVDSGHPEGMAQALNTAV